MVSYVFTANVIMDMHAAGVAYRRFFIRGARHLIFYSLPEYPHFYAEIVNMLSDSVGSAAAAGAGAAKASAAEAAAEASGSDGTDLSSLALCTPFEKLALERIVGSKRGARMLTGKQHTFMFY